MISPLSPLSPGTLCRTKPTDLVFIIDSSRSVRPHEFEKIKVFVSRVIEALDVGPNATRVGIINYASAVRSELSLQGPQSKAALLQAVRRIQPLSTGTMTGLAIQFAISRAFSAAEGARGSAPNFKKVKRGWFFQLLAWDSSWSGWEKQKGGFFWALVVCDTWGLIVTGGKPLGGANKRFENLQEGLKTSQFFLETSGR